MRCSKLKDVLLTTCNLRPVRSNFKVGSWLFLAVLATVVVLNCKNFRKPSDGGTRIKFDGYKLYVKDCGSGGPTVIIENGLSCNTALYDRMFINISMYTRVLSYDHAGIGRSTSNGKPRTIDNFTRELKALLEQKKIDPPYILVGHSMGGFLIRYFTYLYPDQVAGLVFIDAPHEDWFAYIRSHHTSDELQYFNSFFDPKQRKLKKTLLEELAGYSGLCDSIRGKKIPSHIPVRMYTGKKHGGWAANFGYTPVDLNVWAEMQGSILIGVNDAQQFVDSTASHVFHQDKPELVNNGIRELVEKYRSTTLIDSGTAR